MYGSHFHALSVKPVQEAAYVADKCVFCIDKNWKPDAPRDYKHCHDPVDGDVVVEKQRIRHASRKSGETCIAES